MNIKQSIQYCNRLTAWVTDSILSHDEAKKRASVIKYWVQVADVSIYLKAIKGTILLISYI
jgi:hypothetical protein